MKTSIKGGFVIGFDGTEHKILRDGEVIFEGDKIIYVGCHYPGSVEERIDARGKLVCPGFINTHVHASSQASEKPFADAGRPELLNCGFLNYLPVKGRNHQFSMLDMETPEVGGLFSLVNLLKSGSTTMVEMGGELGGRGSIGRFVDLCGRVGIRAYLSPGYGAGHWYFDSDSRLKSYWDEKGALADLQRAKEFIREYDGAYDGRIKGMLFPVETATSTPRLLKETRKAADALGVGISIHNSETLIEFNQIVQAHGITPVEYLWKHSLLGPDVILGHCVFTNVHSATTYSGGRDLELLAQSGATVAHSPLVFARRGMALESFQRYLDAGVNMAMGTDAYPQDIISEMRLASLVCKIMERDFYAGSAKEIFNAATLGGAGGLRREDLGRLAPGAKADILIIDLQKPHFGGVHDPIRALIQCAVGDDVEQVIVDGRTVVKDGKVIGVDEVELMRQVQTDSEKIWAGFQQWDQQERSIDELSPPSFQFVDVLP